MYTQTCCGHHSHAHVCAHQRRPQLSHAHFFWSHTCKQDGSKGTAQAEELHVKSAEARTIKEAKDDLEDEESEEDF